MSDCRQESEDSQRLCTSACSNIAIAKGHCNSQNNIGCEAKSKKKLNLSAGNNTSFPSSKFYNAKLMEKAIMFCDFEELIWLIDAGAPIDFVSSTNRETALTTAAGGGKVEVVKVLLMHGANVNHKTSLGRTALMKAAAGGHSGVIKLLLGIKNVEVDIFAKDYSNKTALDWARISRSKESALLLEKAISSEIFNKRTHIFERKRLENLKAIMEINESACEKLISSINSKSTELIEQIIKDFDEYNITREDYESLRSEYLTLHQESNKLDEMTSESNISEELYNNLLTYYLDVKGSGGVTALMLASGNNEPGVVQSLLVHGALIDQTTGTGHTALTYASSCGHIDVVKTLLRNGASIHFVTPKEKKTP